jgi:NADPH-dependent 2,4-dienoyl-CoA reductase/sulfur reductase-like enzyme/rhodanese-related sulfurtransferase
MTGTEVLAIDRENKTVTVRLGSGEIVNHGYGTLVLATGATASRPPFPCPHSERISSFHTLDDALRVRGLAEQGGIGEAVVIGAGLVGVEAVVALGELWGINQTLLERENRVLPYVLDPEMAAIVERHLTLQGVTVATGTTVERVTVEDDHPVVHLVDGQRIVTDLVLCCLGVKPETTLARESGLAIGPTGAIVVDECCRTSDPNIYAGGDCVESIQQLTGERIYLPMGSVANRHGRVIAENIAGNPMTFPGVLGAFVLKVFDLNVGAVGISQGVADHAIPTADSVYGSFSDRPHYYPESGDVTAKLTYNAETGHLLGMQAVGSGSVVTRVDVMSSFLQRKAVIGDLLDFEHGYAPPFSEALDPLYHLACQAQAKQRGRSYIAPGDYTAAAGTMLLDVREPDEAATDPIPSVVLEAYASMRCVPIGHLVERLKLLDREQAIAVLCKRGPRAYQAAHLLAKHGFERVSVVGGGLQALL